MAQNLPFPPIKSPMFVNDIMAPVWVMWFQLIWSRVGAGAGYSTDDLATLLSLTPTVAVQTDTTVNPLDASELAPLVAQLLNKVNELEVKIDSMVESPPSGSSSISTVGIVTRGTWNADVITPVYGGTGIANNAASTITISGNFGTTLTISGTTSLTLPTTGTVATLAGTEELTNKTLNASVGKGTWTASGTWTIPAVTLGGTVSGGGNNINNVIIGAVTPLAGAFTTVSGTSLTGTSFLKIASGTTAEGYYGKGTDLTSGAGANDTSIRWDGSSGKLLFSANSTQVGSISVAGAAVFASTITTLGGATLHTTSSALTDGAGANTGTLTNSPATGNPTKWIGINDNGTTRYIPAW